MCAAGTKAPQGNPAVNCFFPRESVEQRRRINWRTHYKLVEERSREGKRKALDLCNLARGIMSFLGALTGNLLHAAAAHRFQIDGRRERNQSFIRTNVRAGSFTADVLFAGSQSQNVTSPALLIVRFAYQTAGNLAGLLFPPRAQTDQRPPI